MKFLFIVCIIIILVFKYYQMYTTNNIQSISTSNSSNVEESQLWQDLIRMQTPYTTSPCAFCYPGTPLLPDITKIASLAMSKQINLIGTHTIGVTSTSNENIGESGFEIAQHYERELIFWIGKLLCKHDPEHVKDIVDGYMCGGGTEANIESFWIAREYLRKTMEHPDEPIYVLFTDLTHYSITKAMHMMDIKFVEKVKHTNKFEMDTNDLYDKIVMLNSKGVKHFIVVGTVGTTSCGSIDPISEMSVVLTKVQKEFGVHTYLHVDASFGGFTVPFVTNNVMIGFENAAVQSVTVDADKMGRLPYPSGMFLCRKGLQKYVETRVQYIRGHTDDTVSGSRTAISAVAGYYYSQKYGYVGHSEYVNSCIRHRNMLVSFLSKIKGVTVLPHSAYINMLPIIIDVVDGKIPSEETEKGIMKDYHMRSDEVNVNGKMCTVYKLCIMEHTFPYIEQFVSDVERMFNKYH